MWRGQTTPKIGDKSFGAGRSPGLALSESIVKITCFSFNNDKDGCKFEKEKMDNAKSYMHVLAVPVGDI